MSEHIQQDMEASLFSGTRLTGSEFSECNMQGAGFIQDNMRGAGFVENDMCGAGFLQCNLSGTGLEKCDLTGAAIECCKLDGMTINGIDVQEMIEFYKNNYKENTTMNKATRKAIIAGNWKMNKTRPEAKALLDELKGMVADIKTVEI